MGLAPEFPTTATGYESVLSAVIERTVGPQAAEIDRSGTFPRDSVQALGDAGLLGLISAPQVGGGGGSLAAGAQVIESVGTRCASTAMVLLMHYAADGVLRLCGGAAFRKESGVERLFRDSLAARVMAPTTDALYDFVGRTCLGLPLFDAADK
jgi:alkylation response protein AidB-like acyl-CoA dehydrogenase